MKGKQAARAANRRADTAETKIKEVTQRLRTERTERATETQALKDEIGRLKNSLIEEARRLAAEEIGRLNNDLITTRKQLSGAQGSLDEAATARDQLMRNMCKYISMTEGVHPSAAIGRVATWLTNEPFTQGADVDALAERLGLPRNGWVVREMSRAVQWLRKGANGQRAVPLDYAEEHPQEFDVHPQYRPSWYEKEITARTDGRGRRLSTTQKVEVTLRYDRTDVESEGTT